MVFFVHTTIFLFCFRISPFAQINCPLRHTIALKVKGNYYCTQHISPLFCVPLFWMTLQKINVVANSNFTLRCLVFMLFAPLQMRDMATNMYVV